MHWFWRATIAVLFSMLCAASSYFPALATVPPWMWWWRAYHSTVFSVAADLTGFSINSRRAAPPAFMAIMGIVAALPTVVIAFTAFGVLTWFLRPRQLIDPETRCRRCGYILRGITEPRCPECGERI